MADTTSVPIAQGEALDLGASTLISAEQSSYTEAVNSDMGNANAGELPGTSSSTVASQVEGGLQTPNPTSQPGNNGRTNGSRTTLNRWRKRIPTAQQPVLGGQPKPETKDSGDGKPRVGRRRTAEEMLAKVKARLKKCLRRMKGHCYREMKRIVEDLVHIGPG
ncbi:hypothetical protein KJ359_000406 [Pestalotiopsis sp. 9143b]|nr:hypothetical protein KJ359_000406 [Pestalotiopsis sp. 9143b]